MQFEYIPFLYMKCSKSAFGYEYALKHEYEYICKVSAHNLW